MPIVFLKPPSRSDGAIFFYYLLGAMRRDLKPYKIWLFI